MYEKRILDLFEFKFDVILLRIEDGFSCIAKSLLGYLVITGNPLGPVEGSFIPQDTQ